MIIKGKKCQQISYIAPGAPARRRPAGDEEPFLRPEIGFTPGWYRSALGIDFGEHWHENPAYRRNTILEMRSELRRRFPGTKIGGIDQPDKPLDLLTGTYGGSFVAGIYRIPIIYYKDNWPNNEHRYLTREEMELLEPPDLDKNVVFQNLMQQIEWIEQYEGRVEGYMNWQGILNNAIRLRGQELFTDMLNAEEKCRHLFECICTTMIDAAQRIHVRQNKSGVEVNFFTVSNCLVNMISPEIYRDLLLPLDKKIQEAFGFIAIHNCAWNADPYVDYYATIPDIGYIDMGLESNLARARKLFPDARRALMYTPMDLANKSLEQIRQDLQRIAMDFAPCDVIVADIDTDTADKRVLDFIKLCEEISSNWETGHHMKMSTF